MAISASFECDMTDLLMRFCPQVEIAIAYVACRLLVTLARLRVARIPGMAEVIASRRAGMTFAGLHAHGSLGTVRKALVLDCGNRGFRRDKGQTEQRENQRKSSHEPLQFAQFTTLDAAIASARSGPGEPG